MSDDVEHRHHARGSDPRTVRACAPSASPDRAPAAPALARGGRQGRHRPGVLPRGPARPVDLPGRPRATALPRPWSWCSRARSRCSATRCTTLADALTAVPLGIAFLLGRRAPTRRYTYGYGRAEDLAGIAIVLIIAASASVLAGYEAVRRLPTRSRSSTCRRSPRAGVIGFPGNEFVARYRIRVGRRIGSAALVADGLHARTDGFTSLAVLLGAGGVAVGWRWPTRSSACSSPSPSSSCCGTPRGRSTAGSWTPSTPPWSTAPSRPSRDVPGVVECRPAAAALDRPPAARRGRPRRAPTSPSPAPTPSPSPPSSTSGPRFRG